MTLVVTRVSGLSETVLGPSLNCFRSNKAFDKNDNEVIRRGSSVSMGSVQEIQVRQISWKVERLRNLEIHGDVESFIAAAV